MQAGSSKVAKTPENIAFVKLVNPALLGPPAPAADGMAKLLEFMQEQRLADEKREEKRPGGARAAPEGGREQEEGGGAGEQGTPGGEFLAPRRANSPATKSGRSFRHPSRSEAKPVRVKELKGIFPLTR